MASTPTLQAEDANSIRRKPIGSVITGDGLLCVANSLSGSVSLIDVDSLEVIGEVKLKTETDKHETRSVARLTDIEIVPETRIVLATNAQHHRLHLVQLANRLEQRAAGNSEQLVVSQQSVDVARHPVSISISPNRKTICVASSWSRRLTIFDLDLSNREHPALKHRTTIDLSFVPGQQLFFDEQSLAVFDRQAGRISTIDIAQNKVIQIIDLPWHNMRGVGLGHDGTILVTHQFLRSSAYADRDHVKWGVLLENQVSKLPIAKLLPQRKGAATPNDQTLAQGLAIGDTGNAGGDPGEVIVTDDRMFVAISGTNEIALIDRVGIRELRAYVGHRPVGLSYHPALNRIFVINSLDDTVSVVDSSDPLEVKTIKLSSWNSLSIADRGERHFFDARLSLSGWMSCHSCHPNGHTTHRLADTLGDGLFGNPKRTPSLLGAGQTGPWAWNGSQSKLTEQINKSLTHTMHGRVSSARQTQEIAAFVKTLQPAESLLFARGDISHERLNRGRLIFKNQGCVSCHAAPNYTSTATYDVGLADEKGVSKFNPPSLLGVSQRDRLFHDGRAHSLDDVVIKFKHQIDENSKTPPISKRETSDLIYFLKSL